MGRIELSGAGFGDHYAFISAGVERGQTTAQLLLRIALVSGAAAACAQNAIPAGSMNIGALFYGAPAMSCFRINEKAELLDCGGARKEAATCGLRVSARAQTGDLHSGSSMEAR